MQDDGQVRVLNAALMYIDVCTIDTGHTYSNLKGEFYLLVVNIPKTIFASNTQCYCTGGCTVCIQYNLSVFGARYV